jgi:hypothetical protein
MRSVSRFLVMVTMVVVAMVAIWSTGCAVSPPAGTSEAASAPVGEVEQALTGCELDCPNGGPVFTCSQPCSVPDANTIICNGVTSQCSPICIPLTCDGACGTINDGCGGTLHCAPCETGCGPRLVDCCGDGRCMTSATCRQIERQGGCGD